ncbi:hypothetical protein SESBI_50836 [Sesbania bispinosa]|nr:hypothetical protein SESBI_50836 [Sesbania bispinosa]
MIWVRKRRTIVGLGPRIPENEQDKLSEHHKLSKQGKRISYLAIRTVNQLSSHPSRIPSEIQVHPSRTQVHLSRMQAHPSRIPSWSVGLLGLLSFPVGWPSSRLGFRKVGRPANQEGHT